MAKINKERNYQRNISDILMLRISLTVKYTVKLFGNICHYQFANIKDIQVTDIEYGEMDYFELEERKSFFNSGFIF